MRHLCRTIALVALALAAATPAAALDLNSFRAQHKLPPLAIVRRSPARPSARAGHGEPPPARPQKLPPAPARARLGRGRERRVRLRHRGLRLPHVVALGRPPPQHAAARRVGLRPRLGGGRQRPALLGAGVGELNAPARSSPLPFGERVDVGRDRREPGEGSRTSLPPVSAVARSPPLRAPPPSGSGEVQPLAAGDDEKCATLPA